MCSSAYVVCVLHHRADPGDWERSELNNSGLIWGMHKHIKREKERKGAKAGERKREREEKILALLFTFSLSGRNIGCKLEFVNLPELFLVFFLVVCLRHLHVLRREGQISKFKWERLKKERK